MGKKKAPVFRDAAAQKKSSITDEGASIKAIRTWNDIEHDSEDEFHERREKVLLDNDDQDDNDESDAEVFGLGSEDDDEEEEELSDDEIVPADKDQDEEDQDQTWGRSKQAYYDADEGADLDEMREEETEALKIQKERLAAMDEADFMDEWGTGTGADEEADKQLVESVTKDLDDITFDIKQSIAKRRKNISVAEKLKILQNESPELLDLLNEFKEKSETVELLDTVLARIQSKDKSDEHEAKFLRFKHQLLMNYLTNISFYLVLKSSGSTDLKDHPVIDALVELRTTLENADELEVKLQPEIDAFMDRLDAPETPASKEEARALTKKPAKKSQAHKKQQQLQALPTPPSDIESDDNLEDEDEEVFKAFDIEQEFKSLKKSSKAAKKRKRAMQDDFGELDALDELDMEDKLAKKRSIRDYVAKIDAKSDKRLAKYQGDIDLPYKDHDSWKQKNGVAQPKDASADLDNEDYDDDDAATARNMRNSNDGDEDDFYAQTVAEKAAHKSAKREKYEAERPEIIDGDWQVEDGQKRLASYKILKNKGLTPKRKKENRNARVKNRTKYTNKLKKLSSVRAVAKPLKGTYGGESTGIKKNVVKSVRF